MSRLKSIREIEMERATQSNFGKGISVASGFDLGAKAPLDSRLTVKTLEERNAHVTGNRAYEGMLVYVESDKKTYQLKDNVWEEFGFNEEKFQAGIQPIVNKNTEQDQRLKSLEDLVVGGEGGGLSAVIADVAANKVAIAKEIEDRTAADTTLETRISEMDAAYKNADSAIKSRLDALEGATADLEQIRTDIDANTASITKEVQDRTTAVSGVDAKITAEVSRATAAETALGGKIDGVKSDLAKAITDAQADAKAKADKALNDAKAYTDGKVVEINAANEALKTKVEANEAALGLVDGKIATAKSGAVESAKTYTDGEISKIDAAYKAADVQVLSDAKAHAEAKVQEAKTALESSISVVDGKVDSAKTELQGNIDNLAGRVSTNESEISKLKDAVSNKNSNTIVVETEDEIATENPNPKVGDLAYVISTKRAYIFKGVSAIVVKSVPQGWVVFDEITSELDLVNYLKKSEADTTYRKLADKIAEADLATELVNKIDAKADKSYVDGELAKKTNEAYVNTKVEEVVAPVRTESAQNKVAIAKEVEDRKAEITRVEGAITSGVNAAKQELTSSLTEKETALKAEDARLNNRISKFAPVVASEEPVDTEAGHVWLELV